MRETELALPAPPRIAESGLGLVKPARLFRLTRQAGGALWSQKGKAFLMMLGTAVGIMLLTAVVGLSAGVEKRINEIMTAFGPRSVMIWAGGGQMHGPGDRSASSSTMKLDDVAAIRNRVSDRAVVSAGISMDDIPVKNGEFSSQTDVMAADPNYPQAFDWYVASGDPLDEDDERSMARVCVLGTTVAKNLFPFRIRFLQYNRKTINVVTKGSSDIDVFTLGYKNISRRVYSLDKVDSWRWYKW